MAEDTVFGRLTLEQKLQLDQLCDDFEAARRAGTPCSVEEFLDRAAGLDRVMVQRALGEIERDLQHHRGETPSSDVDNTPSPPTVPPKHASPLFAPRVAAFVPVKLDEFELLEELGRGGMGVVYRAHDRRLNRTVAVKMIRTGDLAGADERRRFLVEAEVAAQLDHPGIVPVHKVGEDPSGRLYIAMAYVDGGSLWHNVQNNPLSPREAARLMCKVAEAMAVAHQRGIIHRDLKPQNILMTKGGEPRITDFGLGKRAADDHITAPGEVLGTPVYMSPEQAAGKTQLVGPAADVYSLGATLYCLLVGRPPFKAATSAETLAQVQSTPPTAPRLLNRAVDRDLNTICLKCLHKAPADRYPSAVELAADLHRFLSDQPVQARPLPVTVRAARWLRRHIWQSSLAASILTAAMLLVLLLLAHFREPQEVEPPEDRGEYVRKLQQLRDDSKSDPRDSLRRLLNPTEFSFGSRDAAWKWLVLERQRTSSASNGVPNRKRALAWPSSPRRAAVAPPGNCFVMQGDDARLSIFDLTEDKMAAGDQASARPPLPVRQQITLPSAEVDGELAWSAEGTHLLVPLPGGVTIFRREGSALADAAWWFPVNRPRTAVATADLHFVGASLNVRVRLAALSYNQEFLAAATDSQLFVWPRPLNSADGSPPWVVPVAGARELLWSSEGRRLLVLTEQSVIDLPLAAPSSGKPPGSATVREHRLNLEAGVERAAISRHGVIVALLKNGRLVSLREQGDRRGLRRTADSRWEASPWPDATQELLIGDLRFAPDGRNLVTVGAKGLQLWDVATTELLVQSSMNLGLKPFLATGTNDCTITICQRDAGLVQWGLPPSPYYAFFPPEQSGQHLEKVTFGSGDRLWIAGPGTAIAWDVANGRSPQRMTIDASQIFRADVTGLAVAPDEKTLAIAVAHLVYLIDFPSGNVRRVSAAAASSPNSGLSYIDLARNRVSALHWTRHNELMVLRIGGELQLFRGTRLVATQSLLPDAPTRRGSRPVVTAHCFSADSDQLIAATGVAGTIESPVVAHASSATIWQVAIDGPGQLAPPARSGTWEKIILGITATPDGKTRAFFDRDRKAYVQSVEAPPMRLPKTEGKRIESLAMAPGPNPFLIAAIRDELLFYPVPEKGTMIPTSLRLRRLDQPTVSEAADAPSGESLQVSANGRWLWSTALGQPTSVWSVDVLRRQLDESTTH